VGSTQSPCGSAEASFLGGLTHLPLGKETPDRPFYQLLSNYFIELIPFLFVSRVEVLGLPCVREEACLVAGTPFELRCLSGLNNRCRQDLRGGTGFFQRNL